MGVQGEIFDANKDDGSLGELIDELTMRSFLLLFRLQPGFKLVFKG